MGTRIKLDEYYNMVGKQMFPDWLDDTINYRSSRKKEFLHFRDRANKVYAKAVNQIWDDGKLFLSVRAEQGYFDASSVIIDSYDFLQSMCFDRSGNVYRCVLELHKETRGRPSQFAYINTHIHEFVANELLRKGNDKDKIVIEDIVRDLIKYLKDEGNHPVPGLTTVRDRILALYPEYKSTSRNSKK